MAAIWLRRVVIFAAIILVGRYYLWTVRAAGSKFYWHHDLYGYYDFLGRAFASGHLELPVKPAPELLALPNPWDPNAPEEYKLHDVALFNKRFYLYHGAGPAVMLFAPWRLMTHHDMPENFGLFLLCFGGFVFSCAALLRALAVAGVKPDLYLLALMLVALGICQSVLYLLNRADVYEIAIGGGYFCISAAIFFLLRESAWSTAAAGLACGLAISCRPHLGLVGVIVLAALLLAKNRARVSAFAAPFVAVGLAVALYNYARFGEFLEFGNRYLLSGMHQNRAKLTADSVLPGLYYFLVCPPEFSLVFPWVRLVTRLPLNLPVGYYLEPIIGALIAAPFIVAAFVTPRRALAVISVATLAILLFLTGTGFTTQRYIVDFLPLAVWGALMSFAIHIHRRSGWKRHALTGAFGALIAFSAMVNVSLGFSGPYDDILKDRPQSYVKIARWFSPLEQYRPILNPKLAVNFSARFMPHAEHFREPLIVTGRRYHRHSLYVEHLDGALRFISESDGSKMAYELPNPGSQPVDMTLAYAPESGNMTTSINGRDVLVHPIGPLVTSPHEVSVGVGRLGFDVLPTHFTGTILYVRSRAVWQPAVGNPQAGKPVPESSLSAADARP